MTFKTPPCIDRKGSPDDYAPVSRRLAMRLVELRTKRGELQRQSAAAMDMDAAVLSKYETGERIPKYRPLLQLAAYYGESVEDLAQLAAEDQAAKPVSPNPGPADVDLATDLEAEAGSGPPNGSTVPQRPNHQEELPPGT